MRAIIVCCLLLLACGSEPQNAAITTARKDSTPAVLPPSPSEDPDTIFTPDTETKITAVLPAIKKPSGIYRFLLPAEGSTQILHTVSFSPGTFRLQEEFRGKGDSTVITEGTWAPSSGFIWLYKDQIVRGRYTWKGDTLQYYSPRLKKTFTMAKLSPASANKVWQTKKKEGIYLYGVGTEPFWSVELTNGDSMVLNMPDWSTPLRTRLSNTSLARDSTVYSAAFDSLELTVYPFFCNDGMSEFLYRQKIKINYKGQTYRGCGEVLATNH
jgi:uncharacterized membrane protein